MDRLLEANKVASVMRRRESARQIPAALLRNAGSNAPRAFTTPLAPAENRLAGFAPPPLEPSNATGLAAGSSFLDAAAPSGAPRGLDRFPSGPLPFQIQSPATRPIGLELPAEIAQAPFSPVRREPADGSVARREMFLDSSGQARPPVLFPRTAAGAGTRFAAAPPVSFETPGCAGRALRVSMAAGFRIPTWKLQTAAFAGPAIAGMVWPGIRSLQARLLARPAETIAFAIAIIPPPLCVPAAPDLEFQGGMRRPGPLGISLHFINTASGRRTANVSFGNPDEFTAKERR